MKKDNYRKTKNMILGYIRSKRWGNFDNKGMDLLIRSMQIKGFREMQKRAPRKMKAEDIVLDYGNDRHLKTYSLESFFVPEVMALYSDNPDIIFAYLEKSYASLRRAKDKIAAIRKIILSEDSDALIIPTKDLLDDFLEISYWKYYIAAISDALCKKENHDKRAREVLQKIELWKNDEEFYGFESEILIEVAHFLSLKRKLGVHGWEISKYLHIDEFLYFLDAKIEKEQLKEIIERRKVIGYISLNLEHPDHENKMICNSLKEAQEIRKHVDSIFDRVNKKSAEDDVLHGMNVQKGSGLIQGECLVVKNHQEFEGKNLDGKVLVTTMSTPKFLPYIKNVKAIVTDTGGMMCHAAITSREYGIPCIVGTNIGTTFFATGDRVEIDLEKGVVKKIF